MIIGELNVGDILVSPKGFNYKVVKVENATFDRIITLNGGAHGDGRKSERYESKLKAWSRSVVWNENEAS